MTWPELDRSKTVFRIMSFDPAISDMGVCVAEFDIEKRTFTILFTKTVSGPKFLKYYKHLRKEFKDAFCVLTALKKYLTEELIPEWKPDYIVTEGAFYHKFVATLISLTLVNDAIRNAARDTIGRDIYVVAPMKTKKSVAARGDVKGKEIIKLAITSHPMILPDNRGIGLWDELSEHEYDAIGHGFSFCAMTWMPDLYPDTKKKKKK